MTTIVPTTGASNANSYVTVAYVDSYAESTAWAAAWAAIDDDDQKAALVLRACRAIEVILFPGYPTSDDQSLQFPRIDVPNARGGYWDSDVVPEVIKRAQAHVAAFLASFDATEDPFAASDTAALESLTVGPLSFKFRQGVGADGATFLAQVVVPMLRPWGLLPPSGTVRLVR